MAFLGAGGETATTILEMAGLEPYLGAQQRIARGWVDATRAQDAYSASGARLSNIGSILITTGAGVATSAAVMGYSFIKAAGDMQATRTGFATMLGSMDAAKSKISELQKFAADTPFDFAQSAKGAQRLLAMGIEADKLVPTMRSVASAVAAAGGNTDDFLGSLTAIGQIKTKGTVSQEEINQLTERGIPALQILQKELGLTQKQLGNLGAQKIDSDTAIAALLKGFDERFGEALNGAAGNYNNAESNFKDAFEQFKTVSGETLLPMATDALKSMSELIGKGTEFVKLHPDFSKYVITFGLIGGGVAVVAGAILKLRGNAILAAAAAKILADETGRIGTAGVGGGGSRSGGSQRGGAIIGSDSAEASAKIDRIYKARIAASKELSRAMRDLDKAAPGSPEATAARARVDRANDIRAKLNDREKTVRDEFAATPEGQGAGGGSALGTAKDIAVALASGEDAATVLQEKLQEIGQEKLDEFLGDPQGTLQAWQSTLTQFRGQAVSTFGAVRGFMQSGLVLPSAGTGWLGNLGASLGLRAGAIQTVNAFGTRGALTGGGAVAGLALGAGAAYGARDDMKALGYGEGVSDMYAGITGAVTAGVTAFFPPARLIVAAAEAFRLGVDRFYNAPLEKAATEGTLGKENEEKLAATKDKSEQSKVYFELAQKALDQGDEATANSFLIIANVLQRQGKKDKIQAAKDAQTAKMNADMKAAKEKDMLENPEKYTGVDPNASPYLRSATGIDGNGAFDSPEDPAPFSMNKRILDAQGRGGNGMEFAGNYGNAGMNPNDYYARSQREASQVSDGAGYTVQQERNGNRRIVLDIPRDNTDDLNDRLKRHNQLKTQF